MKTCLAAASAELLSAALSWTSCASASLLRSTGSPSTWQTSPTSFREFQGALTPVLTYVCGKQHKACSRGVRTHQSVVYGHSALERCQPQAQLLNAFRVPEGQPGNGGGAPHARHEPLQAQADLRQRRCERPGRSSAEHRTLRASTAGLDVLWPDHERAAGHLAPGGRAAQGCTEPASTCSPALTRSSRSPWCKPAWTRRAPCLQFARAWQAAPWPHALLPEDPPTQQLTCC